MKIAFIIPYIPNKIRTRPFNLINYLSKLGHEVVLFTLGSGEADLADVDYLKTICKQVHYYVQPTWQSILNCVFALPTQRPLQTVYSWNPKLAEHLKSLFELDGESSFDIVHVEHLRGSEYGVLLKSVFKNVPIVWDSVDCISYLFEQASKQSGSAFGKLITRFELGRTRKAEGELVNQFDRVLVTSTTDRAELIKLTPRGGGSASVSVLPNGVDLDYFRPNASVQRDPRTLVFSGKMSYHANISMVKFLVGEIMPRVWEQKPETLLIVVGKDPPPDVKSLAENPLITVTGTVEDIRPYLWKATVAVVPLVYGAGIQNKILEAMATGTPVVTTSKAVSALNVVSGKEISVGDGPEDFSAEILRLLMNPGLRNDIASAALNYVTINHNWNTIAHRLTDIYNEVLALQCKVLM